MTPSAAQLAQAADVLASVLEFSRPADAQLAAFFRENRQLGARDRAFIAEAVYGVLRHLLALRAVLPAPHPKNLILAWLIKYQGLSAKALEGLARPALIETLRATHSGDLPLAARAGLPDWVIAQLSGVSESEVLELGRALMQPAPLDLRVNTLKTTREAVLERLAQDGLDAAPTPHSPWGIRLSGHPAINRHPLFLAGEVEVQDEGSQLLARFLGARRGEMVCDFCAGAGGKTLALGAMMASTGRLYAFDVAEKRLANLKPRLARSGLSNVMPQRIANENDARVKRLAGKFDRVLVDAPCSGLGTLRRNPDLKFRQSPETVAELTRKQAAILASASRLVKPGGVLVYATCSLLPAENEGIVSAFLEHAPFEPLPAAPADCPGSQPDGSLRLAPHHHGTDGFYAMRLRRRAG